MKYKLKRNLYALFLSSTLGLTACSSNTENEEYIVEEVQSIAEESIISETVNDTLVEAKNEVEKIISNNTIVEEKEPSIEDLVDDSYLVALETVCIRQEKNDTAKYVDFVQKDDIIVDYKYEDDDWYKVFYNDKIGYVSASRVLEKKENYFPYDFVKTVYMKKDSKIYNDINLENEIDELSKLEFCEVYYENDDIYMIKTNDKVGYISKENTELLEGTFVVVDISDQEAKLYKDNKVILTTPVVTGRPSSPSDTGLFAIYDISHNRYLVGPNYRTYVDVMMKYNKGEGLHDAEYHTNDDGFKHGWRSKEEFGGETYLHNGSHGCVNMPHDAVLEIYDNVQKGDKVLVKK